MAEIAQTRINTNYQGFRYILPDEDDTTQVLNVKGQNDIMVVVNVTGFEPADESVELNVYTSADSDTFDDVTIETNEEGFACFYVRDYIEQIYVEVDTISLENESESEPVIEVNILTGTSA
jgi:hypothetical protein